VWNVTVSHAKTPVQYSRSLVLRRCVSGLLNIYVQFSLQICTHTHTHARTRVCRLQEDAEALIKRWGAQLYKAWKPPYLLEVQIYVSIVLLDDIFILLYNKIGDRGSTVLKVLCYKSEGRWFDPNWCHWNFSLT